MSEPPKKFIQALGIVLCLALAAEVGTRTAEPLLARLGLSQDGMLRALGLADKYGRHYISGFERGEREPPLTVLLRYSEVSKVWLNALVDDEIDLPKELPAPEMHSGFKRRSRSQGRGSLGRK